MVDLVWIIDSDKDSFFGNHGISGSYILPKNDLTLDPRSLAGRRMWFVLRGSDDRLFLLVKIKKVERLIEGYYSGDYLLSPDVSESVRLVSGYAEAAKYSTPEARSLNLGISDLPLEISKLLFAHVKSTIQTKLLPPDRKLLAQIEFPLMPHSANYLAKCALRAVVSHFTLEQVWASGGEVRLGAFSNFAYTLLYEKTGVKPSSNLIDALKAYDPISAILTASLFKSDKDTNGRYVGHPRVDIEFSVIDPGKIYAREFVSVESNQRDLDVALRKTEHAEKIHQAMLKDISEFLIGKGITPFESGSIDLMYRFADEINIIEIKSANDANILVQAAKGAFQLSCYLNEICKDYDNVDAQLVIHDIKNQDLKDYVTEVLSRLGVQVLFYDSVKPWPGRLQGMRL